MKAAIIGGDKRMFYAAKAFLEDGFEVSLSGFDDFENCSGIRSCDIPTALRRADFAVLPIRPLDGDLLNCPCAAGSVDVGGFACALGTKPVFCGNADSLRPFLCGPVRDYASREDFAAYNAALTAEGAVALAIDAYEDSLCGAKVLVLGCGRIGKALSRLLNAFGARVTVAARRSSDRAWVRCQGMQADDFSLKELNSYQMIFNTVPAMILDSERIDRLHPDVLLTDLASLPGGIDHHRAGERGLTCIHALALPGKTAPKAAGRIIKDTIIQIIKEEESGGKDNDRLGDDRILLHL